MKPEQQRKMLEAAAKACGLTITWAINADGSTSGPWIKNSGWNPITNPADTANMCARLDIDTTWTDRAVICIDASYEREQEVRHDGTCAGKEAAWRLAASMVAAKVGGYTDE